MKENIQVSAVIPAHAERIYNAWLSGEEHGKMTGDAATYEPDGQFTAWSGYISGKTLEKVPHTRIVQAWRSTEFGDDEKDSKLTVLLEPVAEGTRVTLKHEEIPAGQGSSYEEGWHEHYFEPMQKYFATPGSRLREVGEVLEEAAEKAGEAVEEAVEDAVADVAEVVERATRQAQRSARTAGKQVKAAQKKVAASARTAGKKVQAAQKKVAARARALGKKVKAALSRKPKAAPKKKKGSKGKKRR